MVAGLIVFERNIHFLARELSAIQARYFPNYQGQVFFHASSLHAPERRIPEPLNTLSQVVVAESSYRENLELLANRIAIEGHRWGTYTIWLTSRILCLPRVLACYSWPTLYLMPSFPDMSLDTLSFLTRSLQVRLRCGPHPWASPSHPGPGQLLLPGLYAAPHQPHFRPVIPCAPAGLRSRCRAFLSRARSSSSSRPTR